mmetsp:Transcript_22178/g.52222  ORF Transcript_22178/g.52222 Transcript_22178/m.52222 type:complete len:298 (-) Transcript_22178:342-1235(-)
MLCRGSLGLVHLLQKRPQSLAPVWRLRRQQNLQRRGSANPDLAIRFQKLQLRIRHVNGNREHLGPGITATFRVLHHARDPMQLRESCRLRVLDDIIRLLCHWEESRSPGHDAAHQIGIVVLEHSLGDDAEAVGKQSISCLLPVQSDSFLHGAIGFEGFQRILPKLILHQWHLRLQEKVALAVCSKDEHCQELLLVVPVLPAVHRLHQEKLVDSKHCVVGNPSFRIPQVRLHVLVDLWEEFGSSLLRHSQLLSQVLTTFDGQLARQELEKLIERGFRQWLPSPRRFGPPSTLWHRTRI